jgi:4-hydroxy-3-methylbut-2-enyl diphosphate reductase
VEIETDPAAVKTKTAMITAHGASDAAKARARAHGLELFEGTCPLVQHAHRAVAALARDGWYPVVIGKKNHVEVRGLTEDLAAYTIVESEADIANIPVASKIGIASQTTQPVDRVLSLVEEIRRRRPDAEVKFVDTVCQPTKQRQRAAVQLAETCDVVVVVGGAGSNNTRELVNTCSRSCTHVYHVQNASELRPDWFERAEKIGLTAGTSTPDYIIDAVEEAIWSSAPAEAPHAPYSLS